MSRRSKLLPTAAPDSSGPTPVPVARRYWPAAATAMALLSCAPLALAADGSNGQSERQWSAPLSCESLAGLSFSDTVINTAERITAGSFTPPGSSSPINDLPAFCRVALTVAPAINIEVWLPENWNQRFQGVGGGGFAGSISWNGLAAALREGYATANTDTGHVGGSGTFALNADGTTNHQLIEDYAFRSLFELTTKAKALVDAHYADGLRYSYWNGCSTGGRQGLALAQQMPDAYDGLLTGSPVINWDRLGPAQLWPQVAMRMENGGPVPGAKLDLATQAAVQACDGLDGVLDGVLEDPRQCDFDPAQLLCTGTGSADDCLTSGEANAVRKIWEGPRDLNGGFLWYGISKGANLGGLAGSTPNRGSLVKHSHWIKQDPSWDWQTVDYASFVDNFKEAVAELNEVIGHADPKLTHFRNAGGKALIWHGWSDFGVMPQSTVDYYEKVLDRMGGERKVEDFARLFMAPGVDHCGRGPGPNQFDMFGSLIDWVENGAAPERIIASRLEDGELVRTRPLCQYPRVATYGGSGSTDEADNFACRLPDHLPPQHVRHDWDHPKNRL